MRTHPASIQAHESRIAGVIGTGATVAVAALIVAVAVPALGVPAHVDEVTVDNPHPWAVVVDVTDADRDAWLALGGVRRNREQGFGEVLDQGDEWTFRFTYAGEQATVTVSGADLERADWRVSVPDELGERLGAADVTETPR